ncbi:hypothetical protein [Nocardioides panzhihuensis]|uniref:DUF3995 domain-containing protein n=1 Tax=Nocardioides panzhihuensis TaxID=860243 RepID=A0A7Z0DL05_9ACTN|nr:hypothetical protein [Nocardioides panzhihuensis]NYI77564.1 hypothetical protein [Nocardioides panzhihuensis]
MTNSADLIEATAGIGRLRAAWTIAHAPVDGVPRWARIAAYSIPFVVLPSGFWRIANVVFGDGEKAGMGQVPDWLPGWAYVILLSIVAELLAFTAVGLIAAWGEVFPRWVPVLGGRTVPTLAAVIPAALGATVLTMLWTVIGVVIQIAGIKLGGDPLPHDFPGNAGGWSAFIFYLAYAPLVLWGPLLGIVTVAYWRRRHHAQSDIDET